MGKRISPTLIGVFVVAGVGLAMAAILLLGSGAFFKDSSEFVLYFPGSVDGLEVGAPVKFKGVTVGSVTDIRLGLDEFTTGGLLIPAFIEIDNEKLRRKGGGTGRADDETLRELVKLGLRAQLRTQSLLTGLLFVQLDLVPNSPIRLVLPEGSKYAEIPTIPGPFDQARSAVERILTKLENADIDTLITRTTAAIDSVDTLVRTPALKAAIESLPQTVANLSEAAEAVRKLSVDLGGKADPLIQSLQLATASANDALIQVRTTLQTVDTLAQPSAPLAQQLSQALAEFAQASRTVRQLADYLQRNPAALVRGGAVEEEDAEE